MMKLMTKKKQRKSARVTAVGMGASQDLEEGLRSDDYGNLSPETHLKKILSDREFASFYKRFLDNKYCGEILSFWLAVEEYKRQKDFSRAAEVIVSKFLTRGAENEVNLDMDVHMAEVRQKIEKGADKHLFDKLQTAAFQLQVHDSYPKFMASKQYRNYLGGLELQPPLTRTASVEHLYRYCSRAAEQAEGSEKDDEEEVNDNAKDSELLGASLGKGDPSVVKRERSSERSGRKKEKKDGSLDVTSEARKERSAERSERKKKEKREKRDDKKEVLSDDPDEPEDRPIEDDGETIRMVVSVGTLRADDDQESTPSTAEAARCDLSVDEEHAGGHRTAANAEDACEERSKAVKAESVVVDDQPKESADGVANDRGKSQSSSEVAEGAPAGAAPEVQQDRPDSTMKKSVEDSPKDATQQEVLATGSTDEKSAATVEITSLGDADSEAAVVQASSVRVIKVPKMVKAVSSSDSRLPVSQNPTDSVGAVKVMERASSTGVAAQTTGDVSQKKIITVMVSLQKRLLALETKETNHQRREKELLATIAELTKRVEQLEAAQK